MYKRVTLIDENLHMSFKYTFWLIFTSITKRQPTMYTGNTFVTQLRKYLDHTISPPSIKSRNIDEEISFILVYAGCHIQYT